MDVRKTLFAARSVRGEFHEASCERFVGILTAKAQADLVSFPGRWVGCGKLTRGLSGPQEI